MTSFISKIAKKLSIGSAHEENSSLEEYKTPSKKDHPNSHYIVEKSLNKLNVNAVYNNTEEYKPVVLDPTALLSDSLTTNAKFKELFSLQITDYDKLKQLAWDGIPPGYRSVSWKILLKYLPTNRETQGPTLKRKREEYMQFRKVYDISNTELHFHENERKIIKLISYDVPRTQPDYPLFHIEPIQKMLARILFIWNSRHPASGYVQGINDITTPFIVVFLSDYIEIDLETFKVPDKIEEVMTEERFDEIEADTYWCLSKIMDSILDNYTDSQPGTLKALQKIKEITRKMDCDLSNHLAESDVDLNQFAFRWVFCLLIREFSLKLGLRLFDTYISDDSGFSILHIYICAAMILKFGSKLKKMSNNEIMTFLQSLPTKTWKEDDLKVLIAEAYVYKSLFEKAQGHLKL